MFGYTLIKKSEIQAMEAQIQTLLDKEPEKIEVPVLPEEIIPIGGDIKNIIIHFDVPISNKEAERIETIFEKKFGITPVIIGNESGFIIIQR